MADEQRPFKLPGSSYEQVVRIILAYLHTSGPSSTGEVAQRAATAPTEVSRNNGFLLSVGIVEGGQKKAITDKGRFLARALEYNQDVQARWREVLGDNEFIQKVLAAVRIRNGMDEQTLRSHIAYTAGQAKTTDALSGAGAVARMLQEAGLVAEDGGKLIATARRAPGSDFSTVLEEARQQESRTQATSPTPQNERPTDAGTPSVVVRINIDVQTTPDELEEVGARIRGLLRSISGSGEPQIELSSNQSQIDEPE